MKIYILKDIEGIKNPFEGEVNMGTFWGGAEKMREAILSQAKKVDIDEALVDYVFQYYGLPLGVGSKPQQEFSEFLQSTLENRHGKG
jgi:hypothetical protein